MKNSLGNPARGEAFFDRTSEIKKIYRVLDADTSIYLAAPRRVGKTSILKHLEEFPEKNYYFIYVITESIDDSNNFFKEIFEQLIKSNAIKSIAKTSNILRKGIESILGKVNSIQGVELREAKEPDYYELLIELFSNVLPEHGRVVIMIDEFPQTIQNILDKSGKESAQSFILKNRALRHNENVIKKISFIYTGSVSLFPMVEKVTSLTSINDIRTVEVNPLDPKEAKIFISRLMEDEEAILEETLIEYVIYKIEWLIPFHIQLMQQEIIDVYESGEQKLNEKLIDKAFDQIVHSRNKPQFEPYFARLTKLFKNNEYEFVMDVLRFLAENNEIDKDVLYDKGVQYDVGSNLKNVMDILESDGYLFLNDKHYRYTSPILKLWCKKHICK